MPRPFRKSSLFGFFLAQEARIRRVKTPLQKNEIRHFSLEIADSSGEIVEISLRTVNADQARH
jgi:hypothetical protein